MEQPPSGAFLCFRGGASIAFSITENTLRVESLPSMALWVLNPKPGCVGNSPAIEIPQHPGAFN